MKMLENAVRIVKWLIFQYVLFFAIPFLYDIMPSGMVWLIAIYTLVFNVYWRNVPKANRLRCIWMPYIVYLLLAVVCCLCIGRFSFWGITLSPMYGIVCYILVRKGGIYWKRKSLLARISLVSGIISTIILLKISNVYWQCRNQGSFDSEKKEILQRSNYLEGKLLTTPQKVLNEMPAGIGEQFKGEWALYTCSMYSYALVNISRLYPETKKKNLQTIDSLIQIVLSPELRKYDTERWSGDALKSLDSEESHVSYISHLAWMIGGYKSTGGGPKYEELYSSLCEVMNRRLLHSSTLNLPTYPGEPIYIPDMLVAIVALKQYAQFNDGKYESTVSKWIASAREHWCDPHTGLLVSFLNTDGSQIEGAPIKGSYSALNCSYLTIIDESFAREQYEHLKNHFWSSTGFLHGFREYSNSSPLLALDIDAGPVIMGLSPSGTAFATGAATYFRDNEVRTSILCTAEIAGNTISGIGKRHYVLANLALVGEAVMLAMRTHTPNSPKK